MRKKRVTIKGKATPKIPCKNKKQPSGDCFIENERNITLTQKNREQKNIKLKKSRSKIQRPVRKVQETQQRRKDSNQTDETS